VSEQETTSQAMQIKALQGNSVCSETINNNSHDNNVFISLPGLNFLGKIVCELNESLCFIDCMHPQSVVSDHLLNLLYGYCFIACIDHYARTVSEWTKDNTVSFGLPTGHD